jgi:hypothetical protein
LPVFYWGNREISILTICKQNNRIL